MAVCLDKYRGALHLQKRRMNEDKSKTIEESKIWQKNLLWYLDWDLSDTV